MVTHITYRGEKYPMRMGYKAIKKVKLELGREFRSDENDFDYEGAEALLFYALQQGCNLAGKEFTLKREEMEDVLDESLHEFIKSFSTFSQPPAKGGAGR